MLGALLFVVLGAPEPSILHRHLIGNGTRMVVSFVTRQPCDTASVLLWDTSAAAPITVPASSYIFHPSNVSLELTVWHHDAQLPPLLADRRWGYRCQCDDAVSANASFSSAAPRRFAVLADFGHQGEAPRTFARLTAQAAAGTIDAVVHAGDFAYDFEGECNGPKDGVSGDEFMEQVDAAFGSQLPYIVSPGNHETHLDNYTHYDARFSGAKLGPGSWSGSGTAHYYSLDIGLMHLVAFDTEAYEGSPSDHRAEIAPMLKWLKADLAAIDRAVTPWLVVHGHKARFTGMGSGMDPIENLLNAYDADIYFGGHLHYYARYKPMCGEEQEPQRKEPPPQEPPPPQEERLYHPVGGKAVVTDPRWMIQIVSAAVGSSEGITGAITHENGTDAHLLDYGYGVLDVLNTTHLHWSFEGLGTAANYTDDLWLIKHAHGPNATNKSMDTCVPKRPPVGRKEGRFGYETCRVDLSRGTVGECSVAVSAAVAAEHEL